jgi:predicted small integral membrane protein
MIVLRWCKAALVGGIGLFFFIVALNNLTDYNSNFQFVRHVLSMDDTFTGNSEMWRALHYTAVYHLFYGIIITTESTCSVICSYGAFRLFRASAGSLADFYHAKVVATVGVTLSLLLWLVAFLTIGGEWFLMWQSPHWNGQEAAFRMFGIEGLILVFLWQPDETAAQTTP